MSPPPPLADGASNVNRETSENEEHRRLAEEKGHVDSDSGNVNGASGSKVNVAPTIQQLKGTVVKDDMNRGFPLESEYHWIRHFWSCIFSL